MRNSVLIAGYYGFGNTGDEAILAAILNDLRALDPAIAPVVVSGNAPETIAAHGVAAIGWTDLPAIVSAAEGSDLIILGGGGLFHDYWGLDPDAILTPAHTGISYYAGFPLLATLLDKRLMLYGVGVGPLLSQSGRAATRTAAEQADVVTVRDAESKAILEAAGVAPGIIRITADPAFGMQAASPERAREILAAEAVPADGRLLLGVALRHWNVGVDPARWEREVALGLDRFCDRHECSIFFLPFQASEGELVDDVAVAGRVSAQMRHADRCCNSRGQYMPAEKAALLGACDLVLGMRLHSLIFAIRSATPAVALAYDPKVRSVMAQAGCAEYVLDLASMLAGELTTLLEQAWQSRDALAVRLAAIAAPLADAAELNARLAVELLHLDATPARPVAAGTIGLLRKVALQRTRAALAASTHAETQEHALRLMGAQLSAQAEAGQQLAAGVDAAAEAAVLLGAQLAQLQEALTAVTAERDERHARMQALDAQLAQAQQAQAALAAQLDVRQQRVQSLQEHADHLQRQLAEAERQHAATLAGKQEAMLSLAGQVAAISTTLAERTAELDRVQGTLRDVVADRDQGLAWLRGELDRTRQVIDERERGIEWLRGELRQAGSELQRLRMSRMARIGNGVGKVKARLREATAPLRHPVAWLERRRRYWQLRNQVRSLSGGVPAPAKRLVKAMLGRSGGDAPVAPAPAVAAPVGMFADAGAASGPADFFRSLAIMPALPGDSAAEVVGRAPSDLVARRADVICFSIIDWEFRYQRPQQMMSQFAASGHRVFYLSPSRFLPADSAVPFTVTPLKDNVYEVTLRVERMPDVYGEVFESGKKSSLLAALDALRHAFRIDEAIGYVMIASWASVALEARQRWGWRTLYDCMDEWENFPGVKPALLEAERRLVREADLLVVTAQRLWNKWEPARRPMVLARNAVDYRFYEERCRPNDLLADLPHPVVGYFGAIADWFDVELMTAVARQRPAYTFVLLGGVFSIDVSGLQALPNVRLLGQQPYETMPQYLHHFDACIIPFKVNPITEATDPVKLYEYLSGGKPVVSVALPELAPYRDCVYVAENRDDFAAQLDAALADDCADLAARRRSVARQHTWTERYRSVERALAGVTPRASIVVVSYRNLAMTRLCLESILRNTEYPDYEVIVVDNASADGTADFLRDLAARHDHVHAILNEENLGFAAANNHGIARSTGAYLVLLNNDTVVPPGWLTRLLRHLADPQVGLVGPVTNFVGNEARIDVPYRTWAEMEAFAGECTWARAGQVADIHMLAMFCVAMRRETFDEIGPLDEQFGLGMFEDDDYSQRMKQKGYRVVCAADAFVHHFGQAAFKDLIKRGEYDELFETNRRLYESKWKVKWVMHRHAELAFASHLAGDVPPGRRAPRGTPDALAVAGVPSG